MRSIEDALFIANDKFDEVNEENHKLAEKLSMVNKTYFEERENWEIEKQKLEYSLRY